MEMRGSGAGGCCIESRYGGNPNSSNYCSVDPYDLSKMDRIMLRFRPIAPKPVPGGGPPSQPQNDDVKASGKGKRKGGSSNNNKRRKSRSPVNNRGKGHVVTLPLLPEAPDLMSPKDQGRTSSSSATWLSFGGLDQEEQDPAVVVVSSVVVEGVMDTWLDGKGLGCTDEERRMRLMEDTCPGFISDGWNRVWWTNDAYRRMAVTGDVNQKNTCQSQGGKESHVVVVKLGLREKVELPGEKLYPAFTCRVRVQYGKEGSHWMTVPCDVWKMDGGGYAWRLDVKAALSLGLF